MGGGINLHMNQKPDDLLIWNEAPGTQGLYSSYK